MQITICRSTSSHSCATYITKQHSAHADSHEDRWEDIGERTAAYGRLAARTAGHRRSIKTARLLRRRTTNSTEQACQTEITLQLSPTGGGTKQIWPKIRETLHTITRLNKNVVRQRPTQS